MGARKTSLYYFIFALAREAVRFFTSLLYLGAPARIIENENHSHLETVAHPRPFLAVFSKNGCGDSPSLC